MTYWTSLFVVFVLTGLLSLVETCRAQPAAEIGWGSIEGTILPPRGQRALPTPITVTLTSRSMYLSVTRTVETGSFEFGDLIDGTYSIKIESAGYAPAESTVVLSRTVRGEVVTITMALGQPLWDAKQLPPGNADKTVSAKSLAVPEKAVREMEKAEMASRKGKPEKSIRHLKRALDIHPQLSEAHNNLAVQYMKLGQNEMAVQALSKALDINHEDAYANLNLGLILVRSGDYEEALEHLGRADRLDPGRYQTLAALAATYFHLGRYRPALASYRELLEIMPDGHEVLLRIADCHTRMNQLEKAVEILKDFIAQCAKDDDRLPGIQARIDRLEAVLEKRK